MGWTFLAREPGQSDLDFFRKEFSPMEILDGATVGSVFYGAAKAKDGRIIGLVCMIRRVPRARDGYNFGYKDMDEFMGPGDSRCPERILNLLSPLPPNPKPDTGDAWAAEWRQRCRDAIAKRMATTRIVQPGMTIKFKQPISFTDGQTLDTLIFLKRNSFQSPEGYMRRYRVSNWRERKFEIVR